MGETARPVPEPSAKRSTDLSHGLLVGLLAVSAGLWAWWWPTRTHDELLLLIYPDLIAHGRVPNRDFFTPYGPGTYWPLTAVYQLTGGPSVAAERVVALGYHVLVAVGVWAVARRYGRLPALAAGSTAAVLSGVLFLVAYGWLLCLGLILWSLAHASRKRWFVAGLLAAGSCTVRPDFIVVVGVLAAVLLSDVRSTRRYGLGFMAGLVPLLAHAVFAGPSLVRNVFLDRVGTDTNAVPPPLLSGLTLGYAVLALSIVVVVGDAAVRRSRDRWAPAALCLATTPQALQRVDQAHLLFVGIVVFPMAVAVLLSIARSSAGQVMAARTWERVAVTALGCFTLVSLVSLSVAPRGYSLEVNGRTMYTESEYVSRALRETALAIEGATGSQAAFLIGSTDTSRWSATPTYFYFLLPRGVPDAYYLELAPGVSERRGSRLLDDYEAADTIVLSKFDLDRSKQAYPRLRRGSERVNEYVREHFCPVTSLFGFEIRQRCTVSPDQAAPGRR